MKIVPLLLCSPFLILVGCSDSTASKQQLSLPKLGEWYTVDHNHPVITEAVQGIGRNEDHLIGARVKGEKNLVYYELYSHSPGYPIWKHEVARRRFLIDDNGTLSVSPSGDGYQLLKQSTVDATDIPNRLEHDGGLNGLQP